MQLVGFYHSHPDGAAVPSPFDREAAWPWYSYLIVPVRGGAAGSVRSWRLRDARVDFVEEKIEVPGMGPEVPLLGEEERWR
jgi:proteasome lid subunit RPN8/RPN11